jgi:hypothetical protein
LDLSQVPAFSQVLDPRIWVAIHANWHRSRSAFDQAVNLQIQIWVTHGSTRAQPYSALFNTSSQIWGKGERLIYGEDEVRDQTQ